jgi:sulfide dehydrogenase cytochrome subunit
MEARCLNRIERTGTRPIRASVFLGLVLMLPLGALSQTDARNPAAFQVQVWAASCMACHGPDGRAEGTGLAIGGRPAEELRSKLLGYKTGKLPATIMHQHAKGYSDQELARIADYFSSLK